MSSGITYLQEEKSTRTIQRWFTAAVFNLFLAATIGVLLRYAFVHEVKWLNYKAFQNGHSHLALMGWAYHALFAFLVSTFLPHNETLMRKYRLLFASGQTNVLLIFISFALALSPLISLSLLAIFSGLVFTFIFHFLRDTKACAERSSFLFIRPALLFLGLSFIGTYIMIIALMASGTKKIMLYYMGSHWFLHLQYNGWLTFAVFGLIFSLLEQHHISIRKDRTDKIRKLLVAGALLTFFLSLFWANQKNYLLLALATTGGLLQVATFIIYRRSIIASFKALLRRLDVRFKVLISIAASCLLLKLFLQIIIAVPFIASLAFTIRNYVISYIHLVFIGFVTLFLFGWAIEHKLIRLSNTIRAGVLSVVVGFVSVELILFIQGTMLWTGKGLLPWYYQFIFLASVLIPCGLLIIGIKNLINLTPIKKQTP